MYPANFVQPLSNWMPRKTKRKKQRVMKRRRLLVEMLEDRIVPTTVLEVEPNDVLA